MNTPKKIALESKEIPQILHSVPAHPGLFSQTKWTNWRLRMNEYSHFSCWPPFIWPDFKFFKIFTQGLQLRFIKILFSNWSPFANTKNVDFLTWRDGHFGKEIKFVKFNIWAESEENIPLFPWSPTTSKIIPKRENDLRMVKLSRQYDMHTRKLKTFESCVQDFPIQTETDWEWKRPKKFPGIENKI